MIISETEKQPAGAFYEHLPAVLVLIAEKKAHANVITRREEVASIRSLLNTAKLMDENQTLYKLMEMEYLERICNQVGNPIQKIRTYPSMNLVCTH